MNCVRSILFPLALSVLAVAQQQSTRITSPSFDENANLPVQRIGADDLLGISVYDSPELTRTVRVGEDGMIRLPMLKQRIKAAGIFPSQVEAAIVSALKEEDVLVEPIVTVSVVEYRSRPINVVGAVKAPLTFQASGTLTLLDALARAGGLSELAGPEIVVTRPVSGSDGRPVRLTQHISVPLLIDGSDAKLNIQLQGGEEIEVPEAGKVYVVGTVRKPGAFPIRDSSELSVMKALALSEGLMPFAMKNAYIYRQDGQGRKEIVVTLSKIMQRRSPDVPLLANDIFYIPDSRSRRGLSAALDKVLMLSTGLGAAAVYSVHP